MRNKMLTVLGIASILALGAHAQQQGQMPINQPNSRMPGQVQGTSELGNQVSTALDQSTIRAYVSLVSTPVVVRNAKGELVTDLSEKDFRVFDNSVQQAASRGGGCSSNWRPLSVHRALSDHKPRDFN
jgi:hypothetical protein